MPILVPSLHRRRLLLAGGALALSGCANAPSSAEITARFPATQAVLDRFVAEGRLPGATVGVRAPDGSDWFLQSGRLSFDPASPAMDRDTLFRIYSMTKLITGAAAALAIEDGRFTLDTPIGELVPEMANMTVAIDPANSLEARPAREPIRVQHLLTHTSGLTYSFAGGGAVQAAYRRAGILPFTGRLDMGETGPKAETLDDMVRRLGEIPLIAEPGTAYNYSVSLDVLGLVIQRAVGMPFQDYVQRRLLGPIGMDDTVWRLRPGDARRLAALYVYSEDGRFEEPSSSAEILSQPVTLHAGGAGLLSTTRDYLAFLAMELNDGLAGRVRVMEPETARMIRMDILPPELTAERGGYGFGGWVARPGHLRAGEYGWSGAAGTQAWVDKRQNFAAVMMIQAMPYGAVNILRDVRPALDQDLGIER